MSQFDFHSFSVQIFWVLIGFFVFYFTNLKDYLSNLALLLKIRSKVLVSYVSNGLQTKKIAMFTFFLG